MKIGIITQLYRDKEYGIIRGESGEDFHFHKHCLWDIGFKDLKKGLAVEFETQVSYKKFLAFHIRPLVKLPDGLVKI